MPDAAVSHRATFRDVLAVREYRAIYIAQTLSIAGDQLARVAAAVLIFNRTNSTFLTGLTYAASYLPWIVGGPMLSGYADRKPRRQVMIVCDFARAALVLCMAVPGVPSPLLIALIVLVSLGEPPFASARTSMIPDILGEGDLFAASSTLGNSTTQLAVVAGFAVGGSLVAAAGSHVTLLIDAATFALSGWITAYFVTHRPAAVSIAQSWGSEMREGARAVFRDSRLRWLVVSTWLVLGAAVSTEAAAVPYAHAHGEGSTAAGILIATLPLGMIIGALVLGRILRPATTERAMLALAILAPAILALTAFDPSPVAAGVIWFISGIASAVTVTANRVFVVAVPREVRGRAFGIAVSGIVGFQGVFSLLTGAVADAVGPARAVADLALGATAAIVVFSVTSATFSRNHSRPISDVSPQTEDVAVVAAGRGGTRARVWSLNLGLAAVALAQIPAFRGDRAFSGAGIHGWWLFLLFALAFAYPITFQLRREFYEAQFETVPLVLGLLFLSPLALVGYRTAALIVTHAVIRRQALMRWFFNAASTAVCTLISVAAFRLLTPGSHVVHAGVWPAILIAVLVNEVLSGLFVALVVSAAAGSWHLNNAFRPVGVSVLVSTVMTSLALCTASALEYDPTTAWAISVFLVLVVIALQTYYRLAERTAALDQLYAVARELVPVASDPTDLVPALHKLCGVLRATSLQLTLPDSDTQEFATTITVSDRPQTVGSFMTTSEPLPDGIDGLIERTPHERTWNWLARPLQGSRLRSDRLSTAVRSAGRSLGVLTAVDRPTGVGAFERSDQRLIEAAADQLAAALERGRLIESLRRAATLDSLTGLANLESLRTFLDTTLEGDAGGVLLLVNLDRFHEVNDMLGHDAGDAVLAEVAQRLQTSPTQGSLVARVGGDQFAIALPGSAGSEVARLAAMAVKSRVDGSIRLSDVSADVRVTIGIARAPEHGGDAATLLRRAEMAMAAAKGGTSGIGEWEPEFERDGSRRLQLLTGLRAALSDGSLRVEYQPKLRLGSGEVVGFEGLVRWRHHELGPISPAEFVPLAEATGLISALTSTVLRQALTACRAWHDAGKPVGVAVNVSARSLDDSVLVGQVAAMLTASGLEPRWLTLEITESSVMEDHARSLEVLRELRSLGVRLSIDDFGTGYSSLHQLRGLPVHEVKIDRSFVESVDTDEAGRAVVRAVVELCDSLGLVTVAEGVEKASQAFALDTLGVQQVQGYFHGRPMPDDAAIVWLASRRVATLATN